MSNARIKGGVEWFRTPQGDECMCARCGSSVTYDDCEECGGEGRMEIDDEDFGLRYSTCISCAGKGGWFTCLSTREWCKANPMPGREDVRP